MLCVNTQVVYSQVVYVTDNTQSTVADDFLRSFVSVTQHESTVHLTLLRVDIACALSICLSSFVINRSIISSSLPLPPLSPSPSLSRSPSLSLHPFSVPSTGRTLHLSVVCVHFVDIWRILYACRPCGGIWGGSDL